jgi:hypothetical protein
MAIAIGMGSGRRSRRRAWAAASARAMATRWFEQVVESKQADRASRCSWCSRPVDREPAGGGLGPYCSVDCAAAVRIAGLYLG